MPPPMKWCRVTFAPRSAVPGPSVFTQYFVPAKLNVRAFDKTLSSRRASRSSSASTVSVQGRCAEAVSRRGTANLLLCVSIKVGKNPFGLHRTDVSKAHLLHQAVLQRLVRPLHPPL